MGGNNTNKKQLVKDNTVQHRKLGVIQQHTSKAVRLTLPTAGRSAAWLHTTHRPPKPQREKDK